MVVRKLSFAIVATAPLQKVASPNTRNSLSVFSKEFTVNAGVCVPGRPEPISLIATIVKRMQVFSHVIAGRCLR